MNCCGSNASALSYSNHPSCCHHRDSQPRNDSTTRAPMSSDSNRRHFDATLRNRSRRARSYRRLSSMLTIVVGPSSRRPTMPSPRVLTRSAVPGWSTPTGNMAMGTSAMMHSFTELRPPWIAATIALSRALCCATVSTMVTWSWRDRTFSPGNSCGPTATIACHSGRLRTASHTDSNQRDAFDVPPACVPKEAKISGRLSSIGGSGRAAGRSLSMHGSIQNNRSASARAKSSSLGHMISVGMDGK